MIDTNVYIHGVPHGQNIWGPLTDKDYVRSFYSNRNDSNETSLLQIDILRNKSFYTYLKRNNVIDVNGRSGSFFAITLSFEGVYFNDTALLYTIFNAVFEQICLGHILQKNQNFYQYLVHSFDDKLIETYVNNVKLAFEQQVERNQNKFDKIPSDCNQNGIKNFSIEDVDSPYFFNCLKKHHLLISPDFAPTYAAIQPLNEKCNSLQNDLNREVLEKRSLEQKNNSLEQQIQNLTAERDSLQDKVKKVENDVRIQMNKQMQNLEEQIKQAERDKKEIQARVRSAEDEIRADYAGQINTLKSSISDLESKNSKLTNEKELLLKQLENLERSCKESKLNGDIEKTILSLREPLNRLTRHLASRFPDISSVPIQNNQKGDESRNRNTTRLPETVNPLPQNPVKQNKKNILSVINMLLNLCIILLLLFYIGGFLNFKSADKESVNNPQGDETEILNNDELDNIKAENLDLKSKLENNNNLIAPLYHINIKNFNGSHFVAGKEYTLKVVPKLKAMPELKGGFFKVSNNAIIDGDKLKIDSIIPGSSLKIEYEVEGINITRIVPVK